PSRRFIRELGGDLFVDVDPDSRVVVRVHVAALDFGSAREHLAHRRREDVLFLNAEVRTGEIEMHVDGMSDRGNIPRTVPGGANVEELAAHGDLAGHVESAGG